VLKVGHWDELLRSQNRETEQGITVVKKKEQGITDRLSSLKLGRISVIVDRHRHTSINRKHENYTHRIKVYYILQVK
jgi:hypothetical protein